MKNKQGFAAIPLMLIILAAVGLALGGYELLVKKSTPAPEQNQNQQGIGAGGGFNLKATTTPSPNIDIPQLSPFSSWETYKNNKFEFKYPKEFEVLDSYPTFGLEYKSLLENFTITIERGGPGIIFEDQAYYKSSSDIDAFITRAKAVKILSQEKIVIGDNEIYKIKKQGAVGEIFYEYIIPWPDGKSFISVYAHNGGITRMDKYGKVIDNRTYGEIAEQILSTFNFNLPTADDESTTLPDMLIFISPQYKDDNEITRIIQEYSSAVKKDIGWNTKVIKVSSTENDFEKIDAVLEKEYKESGGKIKASIMVGEDINTALKHDFTGRECPSTVPWYTLGKEDYVYPNTGVQSYNSEMKITVSLLYPAHNLDYTTKSDQIIFAFKKFSTNRDQKWNRDTNVFISSSADFTTDIYTPERFSTLSAFGNLNHKVGPSGTEIQESLRRPFMMYFAFGHADYNTVTLLEGGYGALSSEDLDKVNSPLLGIQGCFTDCWPSGIFEDNNVLDFSNNRPYGTQVEAISWFTEKIFSSPNVHAMVIGAPGQPGNSFVSEAIPGLLQGKTLAEAMINHTYSIGDSQTIIGDPTFHYNF